MEQHNERLEDARQFLAFLTANSLAYWHLWRLDLKTTFWHRAHQVDIGARKVAASTGDIYVGVGLARQMGQKTERLREDTAIGRMAMVADLDVKAEAFPSKDAALAFAHKLILPPSVLVDSGGGVQCWWVFEVPWLFDGPEDKELCQRYAQGWHEFLSKSAARVNAKLDSVWDVTRIMRVPGGQNHKISPVRDVISLHYGKKIGSEWFADFAAESSERVIIPLHTSVAKLATTEAGTEQDDLISFCQGQTKATAWVPDLSIQDYQLFELACPKWNVTYNMTRRDPRMRDKSKSEFAFSLAGQAAWTGSFPFSKILVALVSFYRKHGMGDKDQRLDWFIATVRKAALTNPGDEANVLAVAKEAEITDSITAQLHADKHTTNLDTSQATQRIAAIATVLDVPITKYLKWGIEPVTFGIEIDRRQIELGTSKEVRSQSHWANKLFDFDYMLKKQPPAAWEAVLRELTKLWELQPLGAVADKQLNLKHRIADMVLNHGMRPENRKERITAAKRGLPYVYNGEWWVPVSIMRREITEMDGRVPTNEHMARDMSKIGYTYERRNTATDGYSKAGYYRGSPLPSPERDPRVSALPYAGEDEES